MIATSQPWSYQFTRPENKAVDKWVESRIVLMLQSALYPHITKRKNNLKKEIRSHV
jgi:hypothetical protein